jgi:hypothetical protein
MQSHDQYRAPGPGPAHRPGLAGGGSARLRPWRRPLVALDNQALAAIGVEPGITAAPVAVRASRRLRLTPAAKAILAGILTPAGAAGPAAASSSKHCSICLALTRGRTRRRAGRGSPHGARALCRLRPGRPAMSIAIDHVGIPAADPWTSARLLPEIRAEGEITPEGPDGEMSSTLLAVVTPFPNSCRGSR